MHDCLPPCNNQRKQQPARCKAVPLTLLIYLCMEHTLPAPARACTSQPIRVHIKSCANAQTSIHPGETRVEYTNSTTLQVQLQQLNNEHQAPVRHVPRHAQHRHVLTRRHVLLLKQRHGRQRRRRRQRHPLCCALGHGERVLRQGSMVLLLLQLLVRMRQGCVLRRAHVRQARHKARRRS